MNASSLEHKTVRPGNLVGYSYYHSDRRTVRPTGSSRLATARTPKLRNLSRIAVLIAVVALIFGVPLLRSNAKAPQVEASAETIGAITPAVTKHAVVPPKPKAAVAAVALPAVSDACATNTLDKLIVISIDKRQLTACETTKKVHQAAVITGMAAHPDTVTPTGTYHIYAKSKDQTLTGSDAAGSWNRPVSYWLPFLDNQYGIYGFHDATWRPNDDFGKISPNTPDASHGCVELPLATSAWVYDWAQVGTTVTIES